MIKMSIHRHGWAAIAASAIFLSGCVPAEESTSTADAAESAPTVDVAQAQVDVVDVKDEPASEQGVQTLETLNQLTQEVQHLRGKVEVLEFELEQTRSRQRQLYDDLDRRMRQFERQMHGDAKPETPKPEITVTLEPQEPVQEPAQQPEGTAAAEGTGGDEGQALQPVVEPADPAIVRGVYDSSFQALREGRYEDAIEMFGALVRDYPGSDLVDDSLYWIAEANYVTKNLEAALPAFEQVIRDYPESQRAPEAMLKIGYIYYDQQQFELARDYLQEVIDKFPASRSAFSARRRLNKMERDNQI